MKKNILHIIDHLGLGGAQTIVKDLVEKNESHRIFALRNVNSQIKLSPAIKDKVIVLKSKGKYDLTSVLKLRTVIKKHKIDVLHIHLSKAIFITYLYKLLFADKTKVIINEHGAIFSKNRWFYRFLLRRINRYTNCYIAVSKKIKEALIEKANLPSKKIKVVYNFIDFEEINYLKEKEKYLLRKSIGLKKDDFIIGFAGRLHGVKYINTLIDSYKYIKNKNTKILIIGDGEESHNLHLQAGNEKNIIFLGFRKDIKELYQILDVIVLPSRSEASPMAFYESQVYGIPFVGSDVYAINEFISDGINGFLFRFQDDKDLADKILMIRNDKKLRENIKNNAIANLAKYDIKLYNKKMQKIYSGDI